MAFSGCSSCGCIYSLCVWKCTVCNVICVFLTGTRGLGPNVMATFRTRWFLSILLVNLPNSCVASGRLMCIFFLFWSACTLLVFSPQLYFLTLQLFNSFVPLLPFQSKIGRKMIILLDVVYCKGKLPEKLCRVNSSSTGYNTDIVSTC